jgi:K+-transporting ATPase KdpF subunit
VSDSRRADAMPVIYVVGGIVALGLLAYLAIALLKPEIFS